MIMMQSSYNIDDVGADNNFKIDVLLMMLRLLKMQATLIHSIYFFILTMQSTLFSTFIWLICYLYTVINALFRSLTASDLFFIFFQQTNNNVNADNTIDVFMLTMTTNDTIKVNNDINQVDMFILYDYY